MTKIKTTVIGPFRKPMYLKTPDWFSGTTNKMTDGYDINKYTTFITNIADDYEQLQQKALAQIIHMQNKFQIDILSDGELKKEYLKC